MQWLIELDKAAFLWLNNCLASDPLDPLFHLWSYLGNGGVALAMVAAGALFLKRPKFLKDHLPWIALGALLGGLMVHLLKDLVGRDRPVEEFAPLIQAGKVQLHLVGTILSRGSFPSGHAQVAFTVATYLSLLLRRWSPLLLLLALGVALSRIYMGVHYPLDVIVGGALGAISAWLLFRIRGMVLARWRRGQSL